MAPPDDSFREARVDLVREKMYGKGNLPGTLRRETSAGICGYNAQLDGSPFVGSYVVLPQRGVRVRASAQWRRGRAGARASTNTPSVERATVGAEASRGLREKPEAGNQNTNNAGTIDLYPKR